MGKPIRRGAPEPGSGVPVRRPKAASGGIDPDAEKKREEQEEKEFEEWAEKICQRGITAAIFLPMIFSAFAFVWEAFTRPVMVVDFVELATTASATPYTAIVTGGCSGMGADLAKRLVASGASVILGCIDSSEMHRHMAIAEIAKAAPEGGTGTVDAYDLDLASLSSTRAFAQKFHDKHFSDGLNLLVHNGGSPRACNGTADGHEQAFQVNYLGHFLLTKLLLPSMKNAKSARVVSVICDAGLNEGSFSLWPIITGSTAAAIDPTSLFMTHHHKNEERIQRCVPSEAYANSKLALLSMSNELERRLRAGQGETHAITANAVNPGYMLGKFYEKQPPPPAARVYGIGRILQYLPPIMFMQWLWGMLQGFVVTSLTRTTEHGAQMTYHVATNPALKQVGGKLFADAELRWPGTLMDCGRKASECGSERQPRIATDPKIGKRLWDLSEKKVKEFSQPLASP